MLPWRRFWHRLFEDRALAVRLRLLRAAGKILVPSYRFKWPQLDWWKDPDFSRFLARFGEDKELNTGRKWILHQLLRLTAHVPGDTAECGVFRGASSWLIGAANAAGGGAKTHHLFDSFAGLSEPGAADGNYWARGDLSCNLEEVGRALQPFKVEFHSGWIPERFNEVADRKFSFVHIDVDLAEPTRESMAFFYPRMESGGIILCDDYGFSTCPGATRAIDEYLQDKPEKMMALPDGGGFIIRGATTAPRPRLNAVSDGTS